MKTFLKQTIIFTALFALSGTAAFFACYRGDPSSDGGVDNGDNVDNPLTPQEKFVDSMTNLKAFNLDAKVKLVTESNIEVNLTLDNGQCSLEDMEAVKVSGDIKLNYQDFVVEASLNYYNDIIYFNYADNYFKMTSNNVMDFVDLLPTYGIDVSVPEDLKNLDLNALQDKLLNMEEQAIPSGGFYFVLPINDTITVYLKSDADYNFIGARCDDFFYEGTLISFDANVNEIDPSALTISDPATSDKANLYQDFEPCFDLFTAAYNLFQKRTNAVSIVADINKDDGLGNVSDFLDVNGVLNYNISESQYGLNASVKENNRTHNFKMAYLDETVYADYNTLKVSMCKRNVSQMIAYVLSKIGNDKITELVNSLSSSMENPDSLAMLSNIGNLTNLLKTVSVSDDKVTFTIDPSALGIEASLITVTTNFNKTCLQSISLQNVVIQGYRGDVTISLTDYQELSVDKTQYASIDTPLTILDTIDDLSRQTAFRLEFDGLVDNEDSTIKDITVNGGLQFDLDKKFGYGNVKVVDRKSYNHNLKVDMRSPDEVLFDYNDNLRGKFSTQTLKDMTELATTIYQEKDDHFMELFGDLLSSMNDTPLGQALAGDYGVLLSSNIVNSFKTSDTTIDLSINGAIIGLEDVNMDIHVDYDEYHIYDMKISNLTYNGNTYSLNVYLKDFDKTQETSRLDPSKQYLDFSDIKVLLQLGINTSKFNYYHFTGSALVSISFFEKSIPLDIKVRNNHGKVSVSVDIGEIPTIILVNKNTDYTSTENRYAHIYYEDGLFYVNRTEKVGTLGFFRYNYSQYTIDLVCKADYFLDNIMEIMCKDVLGFQDLIMDQIVQSTTNGPTDENPIHYENILNNFVYNKASNYFLFDLNIQELSKNEDLKTFTIKVYEDTSTNQLKSLQVYLKVSVGISIELTLNLTLSDASVALTDANELTALNNYVAIHKNDTQNELHKTVVKLS